MSISIPAAADIRAKLQPLNRQQLAVLADCCEIPFPTLWKIRTGETPNPGIDTVRKFFDSIDLVLAGGTPKPGKQAA